MLVIGLDVGTTGTKALVADENGKVISKGYKGYPLICDGDKIEQRAQDWWEASVAAVLQAMEGQKGSEVRALSLSTQGASMVALDGGNQPIGNALTWMDRRSKAEADDIEQSLSGDYIYRTTGWRIAPSQDAAKVLHMKKQLSYTSAKQYLSTLEYMNLQLTGNPLIDPTNAAMRQMYNVRQGKWDTKILDVLGITANELPKIAPAGTLVGNLCSKAAKELGLPCNVKVFNGAHDQYCASLGAGATQYGDMLLSSGTTWVVMGISDKPMFTDTYIASCTHPIQGLYGAIASLACSGAALEWYVDGFLDVSLKKMDEICSDRRQKAKDVFFYPYLAGPQYPDWQNGTKGGFMGLTLGTDKYDIALAIMEGIAFGAKRALSDYASNGCTISSLRIMGGAAKSSLWTSIIQSVTDLPIDKMLEADTCALGAAMIALCGLGQFNNYNQAAEVMVKKKRLDPPEIANVDFYRNKFEQYNKMWEHVVQFYKEKY